MPGRSLYYQFQNSDVYCMSTACGRPQGGGVWLMWTGGKNSDFLDVINGWPLICTNPATSKIENFSANSFLYDKWTYPPCERNGGCNTLIESLVIPLWPE